MVNALRVALAITRATEEDCIAFLSVCKLDFPVIVLDQIQDAEGFFITCTSACSRMRSTCCVSPGDLQRRGPFR